MPAKESKESKHGGDPLTINPRMKCGDCGEFVYATSPRITSLGHVILECDCHGVGADADFPEVWERVF